MNFNINLLNNTEKEYVLNTFKMTEVNELFKKAKISDKEIFQAFTTHSLTRAHIRKYLENHKKDNIEKNLIPFLLKKLFDVKSGTELINYLNELRYFELTEENWQKINEYKESCVFCDENIEFETIVKVLCAKEIEESKEVKEEVKDDSAVDNDLRDKLERQKKTNEELNSRNQKLENGLKTADENIKTLKKELAELKKSISLNNIKCRLGDVFGDVEKMEVNELLDFLDQKEKEFFELKDLDKVKYILSVKFAIVKSMEVSKDE